ncbi:circadian clock protein KaiC [Geobacter sp. DSM 9736]|uniref:circadian clock protein KaiC n=1 Tax=Geobacter sp. DSM 9736 TaxID=1277350 RepID=UPI000B502D75|nr:circadian clock protein KaiC [Geobacter sp. DSM 9736]SNB47439.1 circadian clock protein KaiC [Geobacter sp. DSM 9736]
MHSVTAKSSTGIKGLDDITGGGYPQGRSTLIAGNAGCGKTTFGMSFLIKGITEDEPGVYVTLEETAEDIVADMKSVGMDLRPLVEKGLLFILRVDLSKVTLTEGGGYDIGTLFIHLADAISSVGAKRVVVDTLDTLFSGVSDSGKLRLQLRGLLNWLKERGMTVVVTGEAGSENITRRGFEEYMADCVVALDYRVTEEISTRRLRVVKYRGSVHPSDEFPFLIDDEGITLIPITSLRLEYEPSGAFLSTGVQQFDEMMQGKGYAQGSSVLISGTPGTGKTTLSMTCIDAACRRGERCVYFGFEESAAQTMHNMKSVGLDVEQWVKKGLLQVHAARVTMYGLERHLLTMHRIVDKFSPAIVVLDPMTALTDVGTVLQARSMVMRLIDFLKMRKVTTIFTDLIHQESLAVSTEVQVSSLIDTWILLRDMEERYRRRRTLLILKSRGIRHSNRLCELAMSESGITLNPIEGKEA